LGRHMSKAVSVVMTVYNGQKFLLAQVMSVLSQLLPGDELIIVDDASADESVAMLTALNSPLIKLHENPRNLGVIGSFEIGLGLAGEDIIFLCDQDDVWLPGKRAAFVAEFDRDPSIQIVISDAVVIDDQGAVIAESFMSLRHGFKSGIFATLWRNRYLGCAMAIRKSLLEIALPIPRTVPMQDIWLGALGRLSGEVSFLVNPYIQYRRHGANSTPLRSEYRWTSLIKWRFGLLQALLTRTVSRKWRQAT
jgi:glycosyltransferase involved in cell wall biosynthesis